jgi:hypothetical protein
MSGKEEPLVSTLVSSMKKKKRKVHCSCFALTNYYIRLQSSQADCDNILNPTKKLEN